MTIIYFISTKGCAKSTQPECVSALHSTQCPTRFSAQHYLAISCFALMQSLKGTWREGGTVSEYAPCVRFCVWIRSMCSFLRMRSLSRLLGLRGRRVVPILADLQFSIFQPKNVWFSTNHYEYMYVLHCTLYCILCCTVLYGCIYLVITNI